MIFLCGALVIAILIVLMKKKVNITYKPDTTTQIKLATQSTRQLQLLKWKDIPGGVGCE